MKVQQESEQKVYESRIQRLKSRDVGNSAQSGTPAEASDLRKELAIAKERVTYLEKAYKQKSDALKAAEAASQKPKAQQASAKTANKGPDLPKWGFEPPDDLPHSQPYWDYRNAYSDHIAAMVTATVSAIPHIPLAIFFFFLKGYAFVLYMVQCMLRLCRPNFMCYTAEPFVNK
ncbi:hypothetical protein AX14_011887 [Amanita brunnescens Koide BX004]|nr:hypothetical protein AX14_011887 [Amanita brunnescens Koide BX004]